MNPPCPVCGWSGGFHDRSVHPVLVPVEYLADGDRLDAYLIARMRENPAVAAAMDAYADELERVVIGPSEPGPVGILATLRVLPASRGAANPRAETTPIPARGDKPGRRVVRGE